MLAIDNLIVGMQVYPVMGCPKCGEIHDWVVAPNKEGGVFELLGRVLIENAHRKPRNVNHSCGLTNWAVFPKDLSLTQV